jgi:hypothetical protein
MREFLWRLIARFVSQPRVADWLIERSKRTPYAPIKARDGSEVYMHRGWLFNPYGKDANDRATPPRWGWLPSIRVHHILRADDDAHLHDHPWNARTIVLHGWYVEERPASPLDDSFERDEYPRQRGYTGRVLFAQYHRISEVPAGGVFTLWFTWRYRGTWGFLVDGKKVDYRTYLGLDK